MNIIVDPISLNILIVNDECILEQATFFSKNSITVNIYALASSDKLSQYSRHWPARNTPRNNPRVTATGLEQAING
jgi:hypothetical protein